MGYTNNPIPYVPLFSIKFIGEPPVDEDDYLSKLYLLISGACDDDPGEDGE